MPVVSVLNSAYQIMRKNPQIIVPEIIFLLVGVIYSYLVLYPSLEGLAVGGSGAVITVIVLSLIFLIFSTAFTGFYVSIADQGFKGQKPSFDTALAVTRERYVNLFAVTLIVSVLSLVLFGIVLLIAIYASFGGVPNLGLFTNATNSTAIVQNVMTSLGATHILTFLIILLVLGAIVYALITILFYQYIIAVIIENKTVTQSLSRSIEIGKSNVWNIIKITIAVVIIAAIISSVFGVIVSIFAYVNDILGELVNIVLTSLISVWSMLIPVMFYHEYVLKEKSGQSSVPPSTTPPAAKPLPKSKKQSTPYT